MRRQKFLGANVAFVVVHHFVEAVVRRLVLVGRCDRIPGDAAARHVIERVEQPRAVERMVIGGRQRQGEAHARAALAISGIIGVMS